MKINLPRCGVWVFLSGLSVAASVCAGPTHTHGIAHLQIAVAGQTVRADFDLPGIDLLGFEHAPASVEEEALLEAAGTKLRDAAAVLVLTPAAHCSVVKVDFRSAQPDPVSTHREFVVSYSFQCTQPAALLGFNTGVFSMFPSLHQLAVQSQTPHGSRSQNLSTTSTAYTF
jgi:Protein of unknown function (DUF2796)